MKTRGKAQASVVLSAELSASSDIRTERLLALIGILKYYYPTKALNTS